MAPERVTVPAVVLLRAMPEPPRIALTVPLCISNVPVLVRTPEVPVMLPPLATVTAPTLSEKSPTDRIAAAPSTVTAPVLRALLIP